MPRTASASASAATAAAAASAASATAATTTTAAASTAAAVLPAAPLRRRQPAETSRLILGARGKQEIGELHHHTRQQPLPQRPWPGAVFLVHVRHEDGRELRVELELGPTRQKAPVR
jgi:hypothetical protein